MRWFGVGTVEAIFFVASASAALARAAASSARASASFRALVSNASAFTAFAADASLSLESARSFSTSFFIADVCFALKKVSAPFASRRGGRLFRVCSIAAATASRFDASAVFSASSDCFSAWRSVAHSARSSSFARVAAAVSAAAAERRTRAASRARRESASSPSAEEASSARSAFAASFRASASVVLNALELQPAPVDKRFSPYQYWTQDTFANMTCVKANCSGRGIPFCIGVSLDVAARALACVDGLDVQ